MDALALTRHLVGLNTTNPPGSEDLAIDALEELLREAGFEVRRHCFAPGRSNLIAVLKGTGARPGLAFTGHVDTVPFGDAPWSVDPLSGTIRDGRIYGRGTADMKAGVAAFVTAALEVARKGRPPCDLTLVITAGEETGCQGAEAMRRDDIALPPIAGWIVAEPTGNKLALGHKGAIFARIEWSGRTAHSSMPEQGDNAIYKACRAVLDIRQMPLDAPRHPVLGDPTRNVGLIGGGHAANAVPDKAWIVTDVRTVPSMDNSGVLAALRSAAQGCSEFAVMYDMAAVWTDPSSALVSLCRDVSRRVGIPHHDVIGMPFFTDASSLTKMRPVPVVIVGPGEAAQAHTTDEWCSIAQIEQATQLYVALMEGEPGPHTAA